MSSLSSRRFAFGLAAFIAAYAAAPLFLSRSHVLNGVGNIGQSLILAVAVMAAYLNVRQGQRKGTSNPFWQLTSLGFFLWFSSQLMWSYYESYLRVQVPNAYSGDVLFFMHMVPLIAAATTQLHAENDRFRFGYLDFSLLLLWWFFLYAYIVGPWQFVQRNEVAFGTRYNILYALENLTLLGALGLLWFRASGDWKRIYSHLFTASLMYGVSSLIINIAVDQKKYYTGSFYDIPLVASMAWCAYAGFLAFRLDPAPERPLISAQTQTRWHSRFAAVALFTMPFFAAWATLDSAIGPAIQRYRMLLTLVTMVLLIVLLCCKEELLQRRLMALLLESRESYDNLQRLQEDLLQTEKLAAIGRLVAGAAHEINNPLTAILGFSDLLADDESGSQEHRRIAEQIRHQARRTKILVSSMLTFAKQSPMKKAPVDMNVVVSNALQLRDLDRTMQKIRVVRDLQPGLPPILGDLDRLLQVCFHIFHNAIDAMDDARDGVMTVSTRHVDGRIVFRCADTGPGVIDPKAVFDPFYTTKTPGKGTGLSLSACYGIIQEHNGQITCENGPHGGAVFTVTLPMAEPQNAGQGEEVGKEKLFKSHASASLHKD